MHFICRKKYLLLKFTQTWPHSLTQNIQPRPTHTGFREGCQVLWWTGRNEHGLVGFSFHLQGSGEDSSPYLGSCRGKNAISQCIPVRGLTALHLMHNQLQEPGGQSLGSWCNRPEVLGKVLFKQHRALQGMREGWARLAHPSSVKAWSLSLSELSRKAKCFAPADSLSGPAGGWGTASVFKPQPCFVSLFCSPAFLLAQAHPPPTNGWSDFVFLLFYFDNFYSDLFACLAS